MKKIIFCMLAMFFVLNTIYAAFPVKAPAAQGGTAVAATVSEHRNATTETRQHTNFVTRVKNKILDIMPGSWEHGEGMRAMFWALWGIFIWPLGILAIVHGIRGLNSRSGIEQDRATLALILGIGEVLLTILFIAFFFFII